MPLELRGLWAAGGWDVAAQPRARLERAHAGTEEPTAEPGLAAPPSTAPGAAAAWLCLLLPAAEILQKSS